MAKSKAGYWLSDDGLNLLKGWARNGLIDEQIAENMGISTMTLYRWKDKYSCICEALKQSKEICDNNVENALYQNALDGNVTAQIFWLKNRRKKQWRDKPDDDVNEAILAKAAELLGDIESVIK